MVSLIVLALMTWPILDIALAVLVIGLLIKLFKWIFGH